jgi:hypothetical protein
LKAFVYGEGRSCRVWMQWAVARGRLLANQQLAALEARKHRRPTTEPPKHQRIRPSGMRMMRPNIPVLP